VTFVNPSHDTPMDLDCTIDGIKPGAVSARMLQHADFNAANTFDQPDLIVPKPFQAKVDGQRVLATLPPLAIVTMNVTAA
jgi:alpha-L-arabinofuranosidase